ncbi:MAG: FKBP-type peptidyl-prolyl cis-trans isomerase [Candidatus Saccharimonadales bacterium]
MSLKRDRIFAGFGAVLFLVSAVALTAAVIFQNVESPSTTPATPAASQTPDPTKTDTPKLAGTELKGFTPVSSIPKLKTIDTQVGTGQVVKPSDTVTVIYTGAIASTGKIFESSLDSTKTDTFPLSSVIKGWSEGIPGMKVGGSRQIMIPSALAYGAAGKGEIPPNADLVFDVTLISIGK